MTAQAYEVLHHQGRTCQMASLPLSLYFALAGVRPDFRFRSTALWRGYVGIWEVVDDRLYLVGIRGELGTGEPLALETVFPGYPDRVFAHWYSDVARVPQGRLVDYRHLGFASQYEADLLLTFEKGVLTSSEHRRNLAIPNEGASPRKQSWINFLGFSGAAARRNERSIAEPQETGLRE